MKLAAFAVVAAVAARASPATSGRSDRETVLQQAFLGNAPSEGQAERFVLELAPGKTISVSEDEKWALKREGVRFFDVTSHQGADASSNSVGGPPADSSVITFPAEPRHTSRVRELLPHLSKGHMRRHLEKFTSFHTRYYKSSSGRESAAWLFDRVRQTLAESAAAEHAHVERFDHPWGQPSIIARIPGRTNRTVVVGAHQDSINMWAPAFLAAPGADDDGSGTVTILEALRVLLSDADSPLAHGNATNTVEFHWYSAEEGGLLGSQAVFSAYRAQGRDVRAMLQQDMTGYVAGTLRAGQLESVGVVTDFVHPGLTAFIKEIIKAYCDIPAVETRCGYACSDHASAAKAGYPSAFVIESAFDNHDPYIHTGNDKIEALSFDHMLQHARLTLGLAYELALAEV